MMSREQHVRGRHLGAKRGIRAQQMLPAGALQISGKEEVASAERETHDETQIVLILEAGIRIAVKPVADARELKRCGGAWWAEFLADGAHKTGHRRTDDSVFGLQPPDH